jgi:hypothetical protein
LIAQVEESLLCYKRLCHVNFDTLVNISNCKRVRGIPDLKKPDLVVCKLCQISKMAKMSFKSKNHHTEEFLELVHIDLCGPMGTERSSAERQ